MAGSLEAKEQFPSDEDLLRANLYGLLSSLLSRPPSAEFLNVVSRMSGDGSELGQAFSRLAAKAAEAEPDALTAEYNDLFIGVGRGELLPYGSYYLTGFLNEKPLARLRATMAEFGIARDPAVKDPEDHAGALLEIMAGLINGAFGAPEPLGCQRAFFSQHMANWMPHFFRDLENARAADFYRPVGTIGRLFMAIETAAFEME